MLISESAMLILPEKYLSQVKDVLRSHVPQVDVWAYGSRVTGGSHEASDLDLVLRNPDDLLAETPALGEVKRAFVESDLPIRVDVMDWARIPVSFHNEIERAHVVIQRAEIEGAPVKGVLFVGAPSGAQNK